MPGIERVGDVALPQFAGVPARGVEEPIVQREVYLCDQRRHRTDLLEVGGLGRDVHDLADSPVL